VFISLRSRIRQACLLGCASGAVLIIIASGQATAATYPGGGSTFTGSSEGWTGKGSCTLVGALELPLLCPTPTGAYDGTAGNPAGSFAAKTSIPINLVSLFKSEVTAESPNFVASEGGSGSVHIERQFVPGTLLSLNPKLEYTATLVDKTNGTKQKAVSETLEAASGFLGKDGAVSLVGGHTYAVQIVATTSSTIASIGLLGGESVARFDNVVVTGPNSTNPPGPIPCAGCEGSNGGNGSNGGEGGNGANGISSSQLTSLIESGGLTGPAVLSGSKISVKANCPAKVGTTCKVTVQGLIKKGKPATNSRSSKIKQGKTKKLALKVKPAMKSQVKAKKRLLFKMTVKAGTAKATVYKSLKLIKG
jgi:hypothetical protein